SSFRLEFFANAACDTNGFGEGQIFLGFTNVTTDASGNAAFAVAFTNVSRSIFTATATDTNNNASEFSACATVAAPCTITCPANLTVTNAPDQCGAIVTYPAPLTSG